MPPQLAELLQNRRLMAVIAAVVVLVLIIILVIGMSSGGSKDGEARKLTKEELILATFETMGRAIEVQALMAREQINLLREDVEGGKFILKFDPDATTEDRDRALVTLVQSGLMDKNVGLEMFDKGDLTASREEKRIKLVRARNGEIARLIRKIPPIQEASVFISMPEPTIFKRDMVPPSATVQVTLSPGERLTRDKVRSIINLLVGSIENMDAKNVSLTDTNGTVYNSVLDATDELMDKLEERDRYMEQKVKTQLDRLLGNNKYVVTVATYLREAPRQEMQLNYDPQRSSVAKSAAFREDLNSQQRGAGLAGGPVSSYIPQDMDVSASGAERSQRGYNRNGQEIEYNAGKKQVSEDFIPGMMEEITIAVTVDSGSYPSNMAEEDFKTLIARSASPMVQPDDVTIVTGKAEEIAPVTPAPEPKFEIPWWVWAVIGGVAFIFFLMLLRAMSKPSVPPQVLQQQQQEIAQLRELANNQAQQIQQTQQQAAQMIQQQQQQLTQLTTQQQQVRVNDGAEELKKTLNELQAVLRKEEEDELGDELGTEIKSWIEST
jgi:flagellar M-ring protein FliF